MAKTPRSARRRSTLGHRILAFSAVCGATLASPGLHAGTTPCCACLGDIDKNGVVDGADLGLLLGAWDSPGTLANDFCEDVNFSGIVDGADLGLLLGAWDGCFPVTPDSCGHPCAGPCGRVHSTPFCSDAACCDLICAGDPFCCSVEWDGLCVSEAGVFCRPANDPPCPGTHDCCVIGDQGCSDEQCCNAVCSVDPFCCSVRWDSICVSEAFSLCDCAPKGRCFSDHGCCETGKPGCSDVDCCTVVCSIDPFCCSFAWDAICVGEAQSICGCTPPPPCPNPSHECCVPGTSGCSDEACCNVICSIDPFCCSQLWDGICVSEAQSLCGCTPPPVCPNPSHECCAQGDPGCSDEACCNAVCTVDPFCCSVAWDANCVDEAQSICGCAPFNPCPNPEHDCGTTGSPGCSDDFCCNAVCEFDPFCCSVAWDGICIEETVFFCQQKGIQCADDNIPEQEPCGQDTNGGCNDPLLATESIACGQTICGTWFSSPDLRDTDWYSLHIDGDEPQLITASIVGDMAPLVAFVNLDGSLIALTSGAPWSPTHLSVLLAPGDYLVAALPAAFIDVPCDSNQKYELWLNCDELCSPCENCPNPEHACDATGGPGCSDVECCEFVCSLYPFCCEIAWESSCVSHAASMCESPGLRHVTMHLERTIRSA